MTSVVFQVFIINDAVVTIFAYVQDFLWSRVRLCPKIFLKAVLLMNGDKVFCYSVYSVSVQYTEFGHQNFVE